VPIPRDVEVTGNVRSIIVNVTVYDQSRRDLLHELDHVCVVARGRLVHAEDVVEQEPISDELEAR